MKRYSAQARSVTALLLIMPLSLVAAADDSSKATYPAAWNPVSAAKYLDARAAWWESWPRSQRDHDTACISCHTTLPYALARPALSRVLKEEALPQVDRTVIGNVEKRVSLWDQVQPFYSDAKYGPGKAEQSRSTEAVLNAVVLATEAARQGSMNDLARNAIQYAWDLQIKTGPDAGSWDWQLFHLSPWEAAESRYEGAAWLALAVASAPGQYSQDHNIAPNMVLLRGYLERNFPEQPLLNRVVLLWASTKWTGLLSKAQRREIVASVIAKQNADGGWSLASLGNWTRSDHTPESKESDGFATGLITLVLAETHDHHYSATCHRGRDWLVSNQNPDGSWGAYSLNKQRDASADASKFMTDAATGYSVMALAEVSGK